MAKADILNKAIQDGNEEMVRALVKEGADVDHLLGMRGTALCAAITAKQTCIAHFLIDIGCDVNGEDFDREPPLYLAIRKGCLDVARKLIRHPTCKLDKPDPLTKTPPICYAARKGVAKAVEWLVAAGCRTEAKDADGNTALHLAIANGHHPVVKILIDGGTSHRLFNDAGLAPVHIASRHGDVKGMLLLLSAWLNTNHYDETNEIIIPSNVKDNVSSFVNFPTKIRKESPLIFAVYECEANMVKLLLRCGSNPNISDGAPNSLTPLMRACHLYCDRKRKDLTIIESLLEAGSSLESALTYAASKNDVELARLLVKYKANINDTESQEPPLYVALFHGSFDVAWYLIKECESTDLCIVDENYRSLLHALAHFPDKRETEKLVDFLIAKGCAVNGHKDQLDGMTPLHQAITNQNVFLVKSLIRHGANVNASASGLSPLHICAECGDLEIGYLLITAGADINYTSSVGVTPLGSSLEYEDEAHEAFSRFLLEFGCRVPFELTNFDDGEEELYYTSSSSNSDDDEDQIPSSVSWESDLRSIINQRAMEILDMKTLCLNVIRQYFITNNISFAKMSSLPLPMVFISVLQYKHIKIQH